jgi:4-hydroxy-3-polyprenylbenzoate decarboxylase
MEHPVRKIILAITGASGSIYARKLLDKLLGLEIPPAEIAVIFSNNAKDIWLAETGKKFDIGLVGTGKKSDIGLSETGKKSDIGLSETGKKFIPKKSVREYNNKEFNAPFASGSSDFDTMIICPASMGVTGRIANGVSDDLIARAADVMLKERRKLIIVLRETPYNLIHIRNMETLTLAGAIICPATPSFYSNPQTIDDLVMTVVERIITLAGFKADTYRWMQND